MENRPSLIGHNFSLKDWDWDWGKARNKAKAQLQLGLQAASGCLAELGKNTVYWAEWQLEAL